MGNPTMMFRKQRDGAVESRVFDSDDIPSGWGDNPKTAPTIRGRPPKEEAAEATAEVIEVAPES